MLIHLLKRAWKNGRVKWEVLRKFSLNFTFNKGDCCKSDFAKPSSSKAVLVQISQDWRFCVKLQQLWLHNFKDGPNNLAKSKISALKQEWTFFRFFIYCCFKKIFLQRGRVPGSVFGLWRVCFVDVKSSRLVSAKKDN